jgi:hypothetical protein
MTSSDDNLCILEKTMKKLIMTSVSVLTLMAGTAFADGFTFAAEGDLELNVTESFEFTENQGANFDFNGGAGIAGDTLIKADLTLTGAIGGQEAGGYGLAEANTDDGAYAEAGFESAAYNASFVAGLSGGFDKSNLSYTGVAQAGGAGGVNVGLTSGFDSEYGLEIDGEANYTEDLVVNVTP